MNRKQRRAAAKLSETQWNPHAESAAVPGVDDLLAAGLQHHQAGRLPEAEAFYRRILSMDARHADSLHLLGVIAHQAGRHEIAGALIGQAIGLRDDTPVYHNNLGIALADQGKPNEAVESYLRALALKPDYAEAHCNRGNALRDLAKLQEAVASYQRAVRLKPDFAKAHNNLGKVLRDLGKPDEAVAACRRALTIDPNIAETHNNLGNAFWDMGKLDEAMASFQRALTLKPDYAEAHNSLALAFRIQGKLDEARRASEKAIELAPKNPRYYSNLLGMKRVVAGDEHLSALEELAGGESASPKDRIGLHFTLAKAYADLHDHERAFRHLREGNALKRQETAFEETAQLALFDRIRDVFTPDLMRAKQGFGDPSTAPIFIVGMPRSGSTLVEQILASHPKVFGAGELMDLTRLVASLDRRRDGVAVTYPDIVPALSGEELRQLGARYCEAIGAAAAGAERVTDKMPANFCYVGLIQLALPNARIIHTRRDPLDTCFSCFSTLFVGHHPYSYDLAELGRYYRAYETLMEHWRRVLPKAAMLEVQYEDIVGDLEGQARRLISHCGLEWDDACLSFHKAQRPVWTASSAQVRRPIYSSSVGRWRPYRNLLRTLIDELGLRDGLPSAGA
jgi:tetratricopeptide (TPR) repeat protein